MEVRYSSIGTEPVSLVEAKAYLKIDLSTDDTLLAALITGARQKIEEFTQRSLVIKTIEAFYDSEEVSDSFGQITLPYPGHDSVTEVTINGAATTNYTKTGLDRFILGIPSVTSTISSTPVNDEGLVVKYVTLGNCPEAIKTEIKRLILQQYEKRGNTFEGALVELDENAYSNLMQFTV